MSVVILYISGIFEWGNIVKELNNFKIKLYYVLYIDIGLIDELFELDVFLFELIVLKYVFVGKSVFYLYIEYVCIEIVNFVNEELSDLLLIVISFKKKYLEWDNYSSMYVC